MFRDEFLGIPDIFTREGAGFDQMGNDGPSPAAKQAQQMVDQLSVRGFSRNRRLKAELNAQRNAGSRYH
jgi:hypothetical protein